MQSKVEPTLRTFPFLFTGFRAENKTKARADGLCPIDNLPSPSQARLRLHVSDKVVPCSVKKMFSSDRPFRELPGHPLD